MKLVERIRRFFSTPAPPDHPLTEEERDEDRPASAHDLLAKTADDFVGDDFDPDERRD